MSCEEDRKHLNYFTKCSTCHEYLAEHEARLEKHIAEHEAKFEERIAEFEKKWSVEYMPIDDRQLVYLTADDLKRIKLEQEAKGVKRVLCENSLSLVKRERMVLKRIMKQLDEKAKALKEQE